MRATYRPQIFVLATCIVLLILPAVHADSPLIPRTYTVTTSDQRHIFVVISPVSLEDESWGLEPADIQKVEAIRDKYPATGLYRNDGSTDPLWTADVYALKIHVHFDAKHLVIPASSLARSYDDHAVSFFANGSPIRSYRIDELVQFPQLLPRTVSHYQWRKSARFNEKANTYEIETLHGERYVFDITTGEIIEQHSLPRQIALAAIITITTLAPLLIWLYRRRKTERETTTTD